MEHYYDKIEQGWFDFHDFYARMVKEAPDPAHFVEVGCWMGKSTVFLGVEIANSDKKIQLDAVDTWKGSIGEPAFTMFAQDKDVYAVFQENIEPLKHIIKPIRMYSMHAAKLYEDASLDMVFIDASHDYISVREDCDAWRPKVKPGGIIAGHDFDNYQSVNHAVKASFKGIPFNVEGHVWWLKV